MADLHPGLVKRNIDPGVATRLTPRVRRINAGNGGPMTGPGTNTYLVGTRDIAVIDPGPDDEAHIDAILQQAGGRIRWLLATHTHPDHSPAARILADRTGAKLMGSVMTDDGHQDLSFQVTENLYHGQQLVTEEFTLEAVYTPGHVGNHFCFWLPEDKLIFTGDHIMQGATVVIVPPSGDMAHYLTSLELLKRYPVELLAPGHGHLMDDAVEVVDALVRHRLSRESRILAAMERLGEASLEALTADVYADVDPVLHKVAQVSLWAHLLKLEKEGRAEKHAEAHWLFGQELWRLSVVAA